MKRKSTTKAARLPAVRAAQPERIIEREEVITRISPAIYTPILDELRLNRLSTMIGNALLAVIAVSGAVDVVHSFL